MLSWEWVAMGTEMTLCELEGWEQYKSFPHTSSTVHFNCTHRPRQAKISRRCCVCVQKVSSEVGPAWFVFAGMGSQWPRMGRDLMTLDSFRESIVRSDTVLRQTGIDLVDLVTRSDEHTFVDIVNTAVSIVGIQVTHLLCLPL